MKLFSSTISGDPASRILLESIAYDRLGSLMPSDRLSSAKWEAVGATKNTEMWSPFMQYIMGRPSVSRMYSK